MKHTKQIVGLLLALAMVLGLGTSVFAAGSETTGSITVDNPADGVKYTAYKIFDVTYSEKKDAYSYTIKGDSAWYNFINGNQTDLNLILTQTSVEGVYLVEKQVGFGAAAFATALQQALKDEVTAEGTRLAPAGNVVKAENLPIGYYLVVGKEDALANLTTTNPDVIIHDKNDVPFEKEDNKADVQIGDTVEYTITGQVPDTTGFESYIYKVSDTMSDGLTFNKDVAVTIGGEEVALAEARDETALQGDAILYTENGFVLSLDVMSREFKAPIEITYTADVNEKAKANVEENKATLEYSNDPSDWNKTTTITDEEDVFTAQIVIDKYADGNKDKKLAGAEFVLYKVENDTKLYYQYVEATDSEGAKINWVEEIDAATHVTTDDKGRAAFAGLENGTYYLHETKAPDGYNLLKEDKKVVIDNQSVEADEGLTQTVEVENNKGSLLPGTGGIGTTIFYVAGGVLVAGAAVLLITRRRMKSAQ